MDDSTGLLARVGVVIVTYASRDHIAACLATLPLSELAGVVVVDNDSPDDTVEVLRRLGHAQVRLHQQANVGFGGGCNTGWRALPETAELVVFVNPDARITRPSVLALADYLLSRPEVGLVGPLLRCDGTALTPGGQLPSLATELRPLLPALLARALPRRAVPPSRVDSGPVGYVEGACPMARRSALEQVEGFDERYFLCFEELDLAKRLHNAGWHVHLCGQAEAEHCPGASRRTIPLQGRPHAVRGLMRYLTTHLGSRTAGHFRRAARLSWSLRRRTGRMDDKTYRSLVSALSEPSP